jgi:hypothetical protein
MIKRKALPVGTLFMLLVMALALLGVGYGLWSKLLLIDGTINTGEVDAVFYTAFTDDDGTVDDPAGVKDAGDVGECKLYGDSSCDPKAYGPEPERYDKDVGECFAEIDSGDPQRLHITVNTGYPSYYCTVWFDILNNGTIPLKIQDLKLVPVNFTNGLEVSVALSQLSCGLQIDPGLLPTGEIIIDNLAQGDIHIHVEQDAVPDAEYSFDAELFLVQWNEFFENQCPKD